MDDAHTQAKVIAVLKDVTLNEFIETAIIAAIKKDKDLLKQIKNLK